MEVAASDPVHIDLEHQTVTTPFQDRFTFEIDPFRKSCLLSGTDEIGLTLASADKIAAYERRAGGARPWSQVENAA
jgi:3-isopropylmalate/(R)-2-methylmalate dehydratase small subunit